MSPFDEFDKKGDLQTAHLIVSSRGDYRPWTSAMPIIKYSPQALFEERTCHRPQGTPWRGTHSKAEWYVAKKISENALWMNAAALGSMYELYFGGRQCHGKNELMGSTQRIPQSIPHGTYKIQREAKSLCRPRGSNSLFLWYIHSNIPETFGVSFKSSLFGAMIYILLPFTCTLKL
ncbi:uncharacterized protein LOC101745027 isoform X1 [Bombyx mori]|uniref:uncharacterized protein LOC101745027 isoform X1 n=1 Tax=Bombyx mori TaxID=7091 RepID=UPI002ED3BAF5